MSNRPQGFRATVAVIGQTGAGKSQFLNGYLQQESFQACPNPKAVTLITSAAENTVQGCLRTGIDTQGLDDTQGVDAEHVQQMVRFLKEWPHGVNVFALVINGQHDRFDAGTQKLVKLINTFFNDPNFWNHVCIVFTKCYAGCDEIAKAVKRDEYRALVLNLIRECQGTEIQNVPQLPVFFVDSKKFNIDPETRDEYALFHGFVVSMDALPTQKVVAPSVAFLKIEQETRANVLTNTQCEGDTLIETYEDQEREKRTAYDGRTVTYTEWKTIRRWEDRKTRSTQFETQVKCVKETRIARFRAKKGHRRYGFCGPRSVTMVPDGETVRKEMQELAREVSTDFNGATSYGEWRIIREWVDQVN
jgi:predicted GTPase